MFGLFRKKKVKFEGRGGLRFNYQGKIYSVASEMSFEGKVDLVVYGNLIQEKGKNDLIDELLKKEIIEALIDCLENEEKLRVYLFEGEV